MKYRKNRQIRQFLLWVLAANSPGIKMYEHVGFWRTSESFHVVVAPDDVHAAARIGPARRDS